MWDDELRGISLKTLKKFEIGKLVEPVIWWYQPSIKFPFVMWETYSEVFPAVWIASSFKGATGPDQILPDISNVNNIAITPSFGNLCNTVFR